MTEASRRQLMELIDANLEQARAEAVATAGTFPATSPLAPGTPVMADSETAAALFSLSRATLDRLRKQTDFPAVQIGSRVLYNVYDCWRWFSDHAGERIET